MGEFLFVPLYKSICMTIDAHIFTGHRMGSFVLHCMTVCGKPSSYVPYKCTYVPYDTTFGASDQGQMLDV